jgi:uncharacterized protein (TIGR03437 family)
MTSLTRLTAIGVSALCMAIQGWAQNFTITTVAGNGKFGDTQSGDGGPAINAELYGPEGTATDGAGNLYIADTFANRVRKVSTNGAITTIAGPGSGSAFGYTGDGGPAVSATLNQPQSVAVDTAGNLYIADYLNNAVRMVAAVNGNISTVAGNGIAGFSGDGGPAASASIAGPYAVAVDAAGNLYIAESVRVRKVSTDGVITTVAGGGPAWNFSPGPMGDGGPATSATLAGPQGVAVDAAGNIFISDTPAQKVRKVTLDGIIATVAGNGKLSLGGTSFSDGSFTGGTFSGDGGPAIAAGLDTNKGVAVDADGNLFIADSGNGRIREVRANGVIRTVAGTGMTGGAATGDGGPATSGSLTLPHGVMVRGRLVYIADSGNNEIRLLSRDGRVLPAITSGGVVPVFSLATTIQPGSWVSIYGSDFAEATSLSGGDFPTSLGGVSVTINSKPTFLSLVSPTQINLQAPDDTATGTATVVVTNAAGTTSGTVTLGHYGPSFSLLDSKHAAAIVTTPRSAGNGGGGYDIIGPAGAHSHPARPVKPGEVVQLYGVGFGPTTSPVPAGQPFSGAAPCVTMPQITIGGVPATVNFGGIVESGLFQFNVVVPNAGSGDQPLQAIAGGITTPGNVFLTLQ